MCIRAVPMSWFRSAFMYLSAMNNLEETKE